MAEENSILDSNGRKPVTFNIKEGLIKEFSNSTVLDLPLVWADENVPFWENFSQENDTPFYLSIYRFIYIFYSKLTIEKGGTKMGSMLLSA